MGLGESDRHVERTEDRLFCRLDVFENRIQQFTSGSRLLGKKLLPPLPLEDCGIWPFDESPKTFQEYIVSVNEDGTPIHYTCDPAVLDNLGKRPGMPHYLTAVHFRKAVLAKYYDHPEKYSVGDGYVGCAGLWHLRMDNDRDDGVIVFLGDLGRLAPEEQAYWKSFNVPPEGKLSATAWQRGFMAEPADPERPDLLFKLKYTRLQESWEKRHGWPLFLTLHEADAHAWKRMRIPLTDSQAEFDDLVLALTKVLIDSLNEKALAQELGGSLKDEKGIGKFERYLSSKGYKTKDRDIALLRVLQDLRSASTAHRKGEKFERIARELKLAETSPSTVFRQLLEQVNLMLDELTSHFCPEDRQ